MDDTYLDRFPPEAREHANRAYEDGFSDGVQQEHDKPVMTLAQARQIYAHAVGAVALAVAPGTKGVPLPVAVRLKRIAKLLALAGGWQVWEIEE